MPMGAFMTSLLRNRIASRCTRAAALAFLTWTTTNAAFARDATVPANIPECNETMSQGTVCRCQLELLHPTQSTVGMIQVKKKARKLADKSDKKLEAFLEKDKNLVPVVIGPEWVVGPNGQGGVKKGFLYITDHHHLVSALVALKRRPDTYCKIKEIARKGQTVDEFWAGMFASHEAWPKEYGEDILGRAIPPSVDGLKDDPYRTLGGAVVKSCGFKSKASQSADFLEFPWADYLRGTGITVELIQSNPEEALKQARKLAGSAVTAELRKNVPCEDKAEDDDNDN
jgi:hypothetical protein